MVKRSMWRAVCAPLVAITLLTGCSQAVDSVETISEVNPISILATESSPVSRVIALANGSAEIIAALGYTEILIGRDIASSSSELTSIDVVTSVIREQ